ncbi:MAG: phosphoglycerate dehydrogenase [Clostridia bacterium]|nr:phosphoglycerate dehydrogenase [Clostridia bacterium]
MYNILTLNKIAKVGLDKFDANYNISDDCKNPEGIILRSFAMHDMEVPESLLAVGRAGAGTNNIPSDDYKEKGIVVFNTPGANANAVKELAIAGLFMASRDIAGAIDWAKTLKPEGDAVEKLVEKGKSAFAGCEIQGKTLGVIGLGAIGVMVANAAKSLGMTVLGYDPYISVDAAWHLSRSIVHVTDINEIYANSDYITLHLPLLPTTTKMVAKDQFDIMKDGVRILNFSRNKLVDNEAMLAALESGKVAKYVTDFPDASLLDVKNVVAIPHLGASTEESEDNCAVMACAQVKDYLENGNIVNSVNYPNCSMPRSSDVRVCVLHKNVPNMISQITTAFANANINIANMISQNKGDYAYTILDVDSAADGVKASLEAIDGVVRVRVL